MIRNSNIDSLRGLFAKRLIATMDMLKKTVGTVADLTVFRKLRELDYCTSYSHRGRFYTLRVADGALSTKNVRRASYCRWVGLEGSRNSSARSVSFLPEPLTTYPLYQVVRISQATSDGNIKNYVITGLKWPLAAHPLLFPLAGHLRL